MIYATVGTDMKMKLSDSFQSPSSKLNNNNYSSLSKDNILSASIINSDSTYSFWFEINCDNINSIAGFQFELPNNLELLDLVGARSQDAGFQLHHNDSGLILGFSMSGDTISELPYQSEAQSLTLIKLHVKADPNSSFSFPIKAILAGPKGEKLSFKNLDESLSINNKLSTISFVE